MKIGSDAGGDLVDMDQVQVHPTGFVNPKDPDAGTKVTTVEETYSTLVCPLPLEASAAPQSQ